jgi:hypothetical protein
MDARLLTPPEMCRQVGAPIQLVTQGIAQVRPGGEFRGTALALRDSLVRQLSG